MAGMPTAERSSSEGVPAQGVRRSDRAPKERASWLRRGPAGGFAKAFALWRSTADAFLEAYRPIVERRRGMEWGERERDFQLYRRGRYVEFNLLQDRGTRFGLEAGARTESILASMPPLVAWRYDWTPEADSPEAALYTDFLRPRSWADESV